MGSHAAVAAQLLKDKDLVDAVLADYRTSPLSEPEKALFALVEKATRDASAIRREDVEEAKAAGWSDEAIFDAVTACAFFHFFNVWCDALGVHEMPAPGATPEG